ncbi:MAG: DMT family transporter [Pseudomonadota bacterium]
MAVQTERRARPVLGVFWMLVTGFCFVTVTAIVKIVGSDVPPAQSAFLRYVFGLVFLIPMLPALRRAIWTRRTLTLHAGRGLAHALGVICWFYAMTRIPIAEVTAMNYLNPVYVTLLAAIVLGERLAFRRIAAIGVAVLGALIILRPGLRELDLGHAAMLVTAAAFAVGYLIAKVLADESEPAVVVAMLSITVTVALLPFALLDWVRPSGSDLMLLAVLAAVATAGHYAMTLAFKAAPLTVTQPVTFLQLVWATTLGAVAFEEAVDLWVSVGGVLIIASVTFITWREAVVNRRAVTPATEQTKA